MRKGIVMEQRKKDTIVMTSDGAFHRAKRLSEADVGMEVHFQVVSEPGKVLKWREFLQRSQMKVTAVTIAFLLVLLPLSMWYGSNQAYAYVNIDINPSVELKLNDKMQVLEIHPQNEEAKEIVSLLEDWRRKDASAVTFDLIQLTQKNGYVNDENQVLIGVSYTDSDRKVDFTQQLESYLSKQSLTMVVAAFDIPNEIRKQARDEQASVNELVAKKIESGPEDPTNGNTTSVEIEDDDKAIIQSFYKEDSTSTEKEIEVVDPPSVEQMPDKKKDTETKIDNHFKNPNRPFDIPPRGKENAPGQKKKQGSMTPPGHEKKNSNSVKKGNSQKDKNSHKPAHKKHPKDNEHKSDKNMKDNHNGKHKGNKGKGNNGKGN